MSPPQELPPAGWHVDPENADHYRYWDGRQWTAHQRPLVVGPPAVGPDSAEPRDSNRRIAGRPRWWLAKTTAAAIFLLVAGIAAWHLSGHDVPLIHEVAPFLGERSNHAQNPQVAQTTATPGQPAVSSGPIADCMTAWNSAPASSEIPTLSVVELPSPAVGLSLDRVPVE
ncbi:MAG: DUF2510 domain-containing protein [Solirubrobacterales bacterium]